MTESCQCCRRCPFRNLDQESANRIQEIIYWRRPVKSLVVLLVVNALLILIRLLNTGFFATVLLLVGLRFLLKFVWTKFNDQITSFLFTPKLEDSADRTDRNRSLEEIKTFASKYHNYVRQARDWVLNYKKNPDLNSHLIFFGSAFVAFFVTTLLGTWLINFLVINAILIAPACFLNVELHTFVQSKLNKPKTE